MPGRSGRGLHFKSLGRLEAGPQAHNLMTVSSILTPAIFPMRIQDLEDIRKAASKMTKPEVKQWLEWLQNNLAEGTHTQSRIQVLDVLKSI